MGMNKAISKKGMIKSKITYNKTPRQYVYKAKMQPTKQADR